MFANRWLAALLLTVLLGAAWMSVHTGQAIYRYAVLDARVPAENMSWKVFARDSEYHLWQATYSYAVKNNMYQGTTTLPKPAYRNAWAAEQDRAAIEREQWQVWYDPQQPSFSTLYRTFPLKETLYSGIMWSLVIYFVALAFYVQRR